MLTHKPLPPSPSKQNALHKPAVHTTRISNGAIGYRTRLLVTEIRSPFLLTSIPPSPSSSSSFPLILSYLLVLFPSSSSYFPLSSTVHLTRASRSEPSAWLRLAVCHTFGHNWPCVSQFGCSQYQLYRSTAVQSAGLQGHLATDRMVRGTTPGREKGPFPYSQRPDRPRGPPSLLASRS